MADRPQFFKIGARVLNLAAIKMVKIEGASLLNVYMLDGTMEQFVEAEAIGFLALLSPYMAEINMAH